MCICLVHRSRARWAWLRSASTRTYVNPYTVDAGSTLSFLKMASWGRVAALLRNFSRTPRSLRGLTRNRAVGAGVLGSVIGTGVLCFQQYHADSRTLPYTVYAEEQKVSTRLIKVSVVTNKQHTNMSALSSTCLSFLSENNTLLNASNSGTIILLLCL